VVSLTVAAASLPALGCTHKPVTEPSEPYIFIQRRRPAPRPNPLACPAVPRDSPLFALVDGDENHNGCAADVQLRPGTYQDADVLFTCPASSIPMIVLHGHGHTPYRTPEGPDERRRFQERLAVATRGLAHPISHYRLGPNGAAAPPCTTTDRGVLMSIYDYDDVDDVVEGLRRWIRANDLNIELVVIIQRVPPEPPKGPEVEPPD
jgi:hypothetical protein